MNTKGQPVPVNAHLKSAIFITVAALLGGQVAQAATNVYVSTNGNTTNGCLIATQSCTLDRARVVVRGMTASMNSDIVVNIAAGNYTLSSTLQLAPEDSGKNGHSVIYQGPTNPATPATLNGGITLPTGSSRVLHDAAKNIWRVPIPAGVSFRQLYIKGIRGVRARYPNLTNADTGAGYLQAVSTVNSLSSPTALNFVVNSGDVPVLQKTTGAEVVWIHHWQHLRSLLSSIDAGTSTRKLNFQSNDPVYYKFPQNPAPYYFENDIKLVDAQGEWYLDPTPSAPLTAPQLYFIPRSPDSGSTVELTVPKLETLVELAGTSAAIRVQNVKFKNLTFMNSNWSAPNTMGYGVYQAAKHTMGNGQLPVPGALRIHNTADIALENNVFTRTGAHAVLLTGLASSYRVVNNQFTDLSGGGMYDMAYPSTNGLISNNRVENYGGTYADAVGILTRYPSTLTISHNTVQYGGYTGISLGDFPCESPALCAGTSHTGNQVLNNYIGDVMRVLDDGAGIYNLGPLPNTLLQGNFVDDVKTSTLIGEHYPAVGIYLDQSSNGLTVQGNVVRRASQSFKINSISGSLAENNLITGNHYTTLDIGATSSETNIVTENIYFAPNIPTAESYNIMINAGVN